MIGESFKKKLGISGQTDQPQVRRAGGANSVSDHASKILNRIGPIIGLVLVVVLFGSLKQNLFLTTYNAQLILLQTAVVGIAALGMTMIIISGGIDLSVGSNIALSTVIIAKLLNLLTAHSNSPFAPVLAALGGIVGGGVTGLAISLMVTKLKLSPFIVTLGLWGALRGVAQGVANNLEIYTNGNSWIDNLLNTLNHRYWWENFPAGVWLFVVLSIAVSAMLKYTRFGRHIFAIGSNEQTARLCGVPVDRTKMMIYALAGCFAGLAGVLQFGFLGGTGDPTTAVGMELNIIAAVVIGGASLNGGQGSVLGTTVGAIIMTTIANGCVKMGWDNWVQQIVTGAIIILAVAVDRLRHRTAN